MIPKIIHYCWFGHGEKPKLALKCIDSWKKYLPEYEFVEWNENNFDISSNLFVKQAYENKKYAFVSDYVRLYALYNYGGVYMDTDVEVLGTLDEFLDHKAFSGFESNQIIPTGIMGCEIGFELFKEFLDYYKNKAFIDDKGCLSMIPNTVIITNLLTKYGFKPNGCYQKVKDFTLYPKEYFCPIIMGTGKIEITRNTKTIHYFAASWYTAEMKIKSKVAKVLKKIIGIDNFNKIVSLLNIKSNT